MNALNTISQFFYRPALGLLLIRLSLGLVFIHHGWIKFSNIPGTTGFMSMIGLPGFMAYVIIAIEILGGAMIILGVMTRLAAALTGIAMLVAIGLVTFPMQGFWGSEFEIVLALASFGIAMIGAGKLRLVHIFEHDHRVVASNTV